MYEAGWPVSELAHLQVRSCLPGHNFVNISLRLYACRAGPPCRDLGYRLPGSRLKRADLSHINRRNGPARLLRTRSNTFGAVSQKKFPSFNFTQKNDGTWLLIAGLAHFSDSSYKTGLACWRASSLTGQPASYKQALRGWISFSIDFAKTCLIACSPIVTNLLTIKVQLKSDIFLSTSNL